MITITEDLNGVLGPGDTHGAGEVAWGSVELDLVEFGTGMWDVWLFATNATDSEWTDFHIGIEGLA